MSDPEDTFDVALEELVRQGRVIRTIDEEGRYVYRLAVN